jgi:nucleoside-diphosphate-sugar epimerase
MILVTGATSQVGEILISKLVDSGKKVRCFTRKTSNIERINKENVEFYVGHFDNIESIKNALHGVEYIVHIGGIWHGKNILNAADQMGIKLKKAIFIGSTSKFQKINSEDARELELVRKMTEAENVINESSQHTIILRPTMLYGIDKDKNILNIIKIMNKFRLFPVIGKGIGMKQPVYVGDVADGIIKAMYREGLNKGEFNLPGAEPVQYNAMLKIIKKTLNKKVFIFHVPVWIAMIGFRFYKLINPKTIVNKAMIKRVNKDYIFDYKEASEAFGYNPVSFEQGVERQVSFLREKGKI